MSDLTRREFLRGAAAAGAALFVAGSHAAQAEAPHAPAESARLIAHPGQASEFPSAVVAKGSNADTPAAILQAALDALGGIGRFVKAGQSVAIKPNATWAYPPGTASSTDPGMLAALITLVRAAGAARVIVVDRSTLWPTTEVLQQTGIGTVLADLDVEWLIPDGPVAPANLCAAIELPHGKAFKKLNVLKAAVEADVRINLAVAKSHKVTKYTLCLKHMMGWIQTPGQIHARLEQGIADLSTASPLTAHLHILEAIRVRLVGQAGGKQTELTAPKVVARPNEIVAGVDPVLIDAYGLETYFGRKPKELAHVFLAGQAGIGEADVQKALDTGLLRLYSVSPGGPQRIAQRPAVTSAAAPTNTATPAHTPTSAPPTTSAPSATARAAGASPSSTAASTPATLPTSTNTVPPTAAPPPTSTLLPTSIPTNTPLPTPLPPAGGEAAASAGASAATSASGVLNPAPFLNLALAPVAAVIVGAGIVYRGRVSARIGARAEPPAADQPADPIVYQAESEDAHHEGDADNA